MGLLLADLYDKAVSTPVDGQLEVEGVESLYEQFFGLWRRLAATTPNGEPMMTNLVSTHHKIVSLLCERAWAPKSVRLPCRKCGGMFVSHRRRKDAAWNFSRSCGKCAKNTIGATLVDNPRPDGGLRFGGSLPYDFKRKENPLNLVICAQSVMCAHPTCLECFLVTDNKTRYCPRCRTLSREQIARARRHKPQPKHRRFEFALRPDADPTTRVTTTGCNGRQLVITRDEPCRPSDELELLNLAGNAFLSARPL